MPAKNTTNNEEQEAPEPKKPEEIKEEHVVPMKA